MQKHTVGIDVSKKDFHCCFGLTSFQQPFKALRSGTFSQTQSGFEKLIDWVNETQVKHGKHPVNFVLEATGVYYENLALYLDKGGWEVNVVLPNQSKKYLEAIGLKSKTDKTDAKGLCRMGGEQSLKRWQPMSGYYYELRTLTRHYQMVQEQITAINNALEANLHGMYQIKTVISSTKKILKSLEQQLLVIREAISAHINKDEEVAAKVENITAIKGVSELTVAVVLAETNGFILFNNAGQLTSYAGYDIVENQSGQRVGRTKISKKGNGRLRRCMHMPSLNVVKYDREFRSFFERLYERHGIKMKAYVAVQKKLLTTIYALWKKDERYDEHYMNAFRERSQEHPLDGCKASKKVSLAEQG